MTDKPTGSGPRRHITALTHSDGKELRHPTYWCGVVSQHTDWAYCDAQHAALDQTSAGRPCLACCSAIIDALRAHYD